ncbi:UDP-N-acetylmuramoyl-L-alanine--D-glutamate ligase [Actinosynnema sp. NPDC047251]|uniref:UDP-N-acetylmuramoylalanine--D-glutamate ligase n=1 Tax=Saccharothrix espanaensis (strain ATCC 51144 / DSM 44229 / JCM 9112 / NBRC 15066 / NRRL 15764) TaxID=1179773 RepID=K0K749_SACES|nr:UDP-N-acetylmuramoyl-L-alanine--D-glutamate ligase [Saccharothrix espanaensis]CCH34151.1 UDP-N-acetylmuramoylalanine-D-glutamate ligase [Saccharothrix espanaensis DSM 44229]
MGFLAGRHVLVAGAGVTGRSAAEALLAAGASVLVTDGSADRLEALEPLLPGVALVPGLVAPPPEVELVVTSPGWRPDSPLLLAAEAAGVEVVGEVELAWRMGLELADPPAWLAVTGTNGKTTTVGMLESVLRAAGIDAVACGNVGLPVVDALLAGHRVLAVELSSFQLHWSPSVRPAAGVLLNLAEDHLDWHGSFEAYGAAKARVLTGEIAVAGADDPYVAGLLTGSTAPVHVGFTLGAPEEGQLGVLDGDLVDRAFGPDTVLASVADVRPGGPSGIADALAAAALARAHGVSPEAVRQGLRDFRPGAHRAEFVAEADGVRYVNDSKATNPHAAGASLRSYDSVVWVAGGLLKGASVDDLVRAEAHRLRGAVLIGADREVIATALARYAPAVPVAVLDDATMSDAVRAARSMARAGDAVVLAPAAASMDMFSDYAHRGKAFAEAVVALTGQTRA